MTNKEPVQPAEGLLTDEEIETLRLRIKEVLEVAKTHQPNPYADAIDSFEDYWSRELLNEVLHKAGQPPVPEKNEERQVQRILNHIQIVHDDGGGGENPRNYHDQLSIDGVIRQLISWKNRQLSKCEADKQKALKQLQTRLDLSNSASAGWENLYKESQKALKEQAGEIRELLNAYAQKITISSGEEFGHEITEEINDYYFVRIDISKEYWQELKSRWVK
jgi:hypothetical protein